MTNMVSNAKNFIWESLEGVLSDGQAEISSLNFTFPFSWHIKYSFMLLWVDCFYDSFYVYIRGRVLGSGLSRGSKAVMRSIKILLTTSCTTTKQTWPESFCLKMTGYMYSHSAISVMTFDLPCNLHSSLNFDLFMLWWFLFLIQETKSNQLK